MITTWVFIVIGDEAGGYVLRVQGYDTTSTAGDSLTGTDATTPSNWVANGNMFSANDTDQDRNADVHCAVCCSRGGFWYNGCGMANPMGTYGATGWAGVYWYTVFNSNDPIKSIEMKLKPV